MFKLLLDNFKMKIKIIPIDKLYYAEANFKNY